MAASSNAGPLIWLAKNSILDILRKMYSSILVSEAAYEEAVTRGLEGGFKDAQVVREAVEEGWIKVCKTDKQFVNKVLKVEKRLGIELGEGEREAIALALEKGTPIFLTNDEDANQVGMAMGLESKGVLYLLLRSVKEGYLDRKRAEEALKKMLEEGLWLSPTIIHNFFETLNRLLEALSSAERQL